MTSFQNRCNPCCHSVELTLKPPKLLHPATSSQPCSESLWVLLCFISKYLGATLWITFCLWGTDFPPVQSISQPTPKQAGVLSLFPLCRCLQTGGHSKQMSRNTGYKANMQRCTWFKKIQEDFVLFHLISLLCAVMAEQEMCHCVYAADTGTCKFPDIVMHQQDAHHPLWQLQLEYRCNKKGKNQVW